MTKRIDHTEPEVLLAPREAAAALHVHSRTLQRMAERGELSPVFLPSGHRRYRKSDIDAIVNGNKREVVA